MEIYEVRINDDGTIKWYQNGKLHRLDGPAIEYANGTKSWYQNGKLHRLNGPAVEWVDGAKYWYQNDQPHRLDGPAIEYAGGTKEYWIEGKGLTEAEFKQRTKPCSGKKILVDGIEYTLS